MLVEAARLAAEHHTAFTVWRPGPQPRRVMYLTHLDRTLRILDDVRDPSGIEPADTCP